MSVVPLGKLPDKIRTIDDLCGAIKQINNLQHVVAIVEDAEGTTLMVLDGTTVERANWLIDRAKRILWGNR